MSGKKPLVIYHGNCADGFTGAWVFYSKYGDTFDYFPGVYNAAPPDVYDRDVYLVDFSYDLKTTQEMLLMAKSMTILDHHQTAIERLQGRTSATCIFDNTRSGAMIAWDFVYPGCIPPLPVKLVQDRDLWKFMLTSTRDFAAYLFSYPYDFKVWDKIMSASDDEIVSMCQQGAAIERKHFKDIDELIRVSTRNFEIEGYSVPIANLPYTMASDAGTQLSIANPFAGTYYDTSEHRCFSLRSNPKNNQWVDVAKIAEKFGGGGHVHASGFKVGRDHEFARF